MVAKNTGIPLVFGASGITKLTPNNGSPSVIFPGKGFLHETGRYNNYTVEFWARLSSETNLAKRIFGPIGSEDGLYVEGGFLTLFIKSNLLFLKLQRRRNHSSLLLCNCQQFH